MGCNCGKNQNVEQIKAEQAKTPQANQLQTTQGNTTPPPAPNGGTQNFALQMRDGKVLRFGSRLEAEAENVRRGYTGVVKTL